MWMDFLVNAMISGKKVHVVRTVHQRSITEKEKVLKLEYLNSNIYQVISKYIEIDGKPYVIELINAMKSDAIMDDDGRTELIKQLSGYNRELYTDALTGIYNRRYYEERIKILI